jgi:hypothetical protein
MSLYNHQSLSSNNPLFSPSSTFIPHYPQSESIPSVRPSTVSPFSHPQPIQHNLPSSFYSASPATFTEGCRREMCYLHAPEGRNTIASLARDPNERCTPPGMLIATQNRNGTHLTWLPNWGKLLATPWSSGQNSWLQIQRSGFDSRCYQIF